VQTRIFVQLVQGPGPGLGQQYETSQVIQYDNLSRTGGMRLIAYSEFAAAPVISVAPSVSPKSPI
jgi:hypothetical protein